ncbi:MAG: anaerobic ribonucleoside-triphosphate reductase activating protein [Lachnospiraceae bacterium]|nr:anaerobic ribonucleoside-triphosphate reductase activating protein [Lachnospiraceae bacterium]MDD6667918.1 anaerobic ribonucleoside-triphosphate reductase activating protein [Lachnospiraceae bacterium]
MNFGQIYYADIANGPGARTSFFVSGCRHHCKGCFNAETWDFSFGHPYTQETEDELVESVKPEYIDGITILGGEPMEPENQPAIRKLVERIRREVPDSKTWIYSGYTWEELHDEKSVCRTEDTDAILSAIDVLVDGEFHESEKDITLNFRGSANQRIIRVPESLKTGKIVLSEYNNEGGLKK